MVSWVNPDKFSIVKSVTFLATLIDFTECGDVGAFVDEPELKYIEGLMVRDGFLGRYYLHQTFSMLRVDEMIWSFFVNNYLLGRTPRPFYILYWSADSSRLPASMHSYYLCNLYQKNVLMKLGGIVLDGVGIDLRKVEILTYILAKDDHIAPWESSFKALAIYGGDKRFMLSGSGHVAGVVKNKYGYWMSEKVQPSPALLSSWKLHTLLKAHGRAIGSSGSGNLAALKFQRGKLIKMSLSRMLQAVM